MKKLLLLLFILFTPIFAKPVYTITLISDGKSEYSAPFEEALKNEITQILGRDFTVRFPKKLYRDGNWDYNKIASDVNKALKDRRSSLVITLGALSSHYMARKNYFQKPVIATAIINPKMQKIPYKDETSGKHNLTYVSANQALEKDLNMMEEIKHIKKISVLIDYTLIKNTPSIGRYINNVYKKRGITVEIIPIKKDLEKSLEKIDPRTDFVYVTPLFQQTTEEKIEIYNILAAKELFSFASIGQDDVALGALFSNAPATDNKRFIRQIALDVQQIALGAHASEQLVNFIPTPALSINMQTATAIGYTPNWEILSKATILKSEQSDSHFFNIEEIMNRAVSHNLGVVASQHQIELSEANVNKASSLFLPQVNIGAEAVKVDEDRAIASLGLTNELDANVYGSFAQQLFNHEVSANISVNENFLKAQKKATDFVKLDIGLAAAVNYLRILQLRTKLKIEKSNLELSKTNMRSAITRRDIGIGNSSDIYRWQTQISDEKKSLLFTHTTLQQSKHSLNNLLNLPQDLVLNFDPVDMNNKVFMTNHEMMKEYFLDQTKFVKFQAFLVEKAIKNMPSIHQYDAIEKAKELIVESNDDAFYLPTVSIEGGIKQHFIDASNEFRDTDDSGRFDGMPYADNTDWQIGLFVKFPLYRGGAKSAALEASRASLLIAEAQRKNLVNTVEKNVRNSLYQAKASYISIKLAQSASVSSKKNLELIKAVYNQGSIGIIDLLDAQNTALRASLIENNTRYAFMRDLLILQHDIGQVNFNLGKDNWLTWYDSLDTYQILHEDEEEEE